MKYITIIALFTIACEDVHNHYEVTVLDTEILTPQGEALWTDTEGNPVLLPTECEGAIVFPDPEVEYGVRLEAGKADGDLYIADVAHVTTLVIRGANDLTNIGCLPRLTDLEVYTGSDSTALTDITPVARTQNLMRFVLQGHSNLSDISAVLELTNLRSFGTLANPSVCQSPVAMEHIQTLRDRGVKVTTDCE